jgi:hypothetical protein
LKAPTRVPSKSRAREARGTPSTWQSLAMGIDTRLNAGLEACAAGVTCWKRTVCVTEIKLLFANRNMVYRSSAKIHSQLDGG